MWKYKKYEVYLFKCQVHCVARVIVNSRLNFTPCTTEGGRLHVFAKAEVTKLAVWWRPNCGVEQEVVTWWIGQEVNVITTATTGDHLCWLVKLVHFISGLPSPRSFKQTFSCKRKLFVRKVFMAKRKMCMWDNTFMQIN